MFPVVGKSVLFVLVPLYTNTADISADVRYPASFVKAETLSPACNAVAPALAPALIVLKSAIASCFPFHVLIWAAVTNLFV